MDTDGAKRAWILIGTGGAERAVEFQELSDKMALYDTDGAKRAVRYGFW